LWIISKTKFIKKVSIHTVIVLLCILCFQCNSENKKHVIKQKGAHLFGSLDTTNIKVLNNTHYNWITLVPWGFQDSYKSAKVTHHDSEGKNIKSGNEELFKRISLLKSKGYKVFIKPHVWVDTIIDGKWRSAIYPKNDTDWEIWQESYRDFIFRYAKVAEEAKADMFCIGTEFSRLAIEKPLFWRSLIIDLRKIFSGKLTYAANWNSTYEKISFWDHLDFIGIQAYFPLTKSDFPSVEDISKGWQKYIPSMEALKSKYNKDVLFTELGYKSTSNAAVKPWVWAENTIETDSLSFKTQSNIYQSFFTTIWPKDWFAGVHIWQIRTDYIRGDDINNTDFITQGKPVEKIIEQYFNKKENAQ
jgi:hypothetical protein